MTDKAALLFDRLLDHDLSLVFGGSSQSVTVTGEFQGAFPGLSCSVLVIPHTEIGIDAQMPSMSMACTMDYDSNVSRPTVGAVVAKSQDGVSSQHEAESVLQRGDPTSRATSAPNSRATTLTGKVMTHHSGTDRVRRGGSARHQDAERRARVAVSSRSSSTIRTRAPASSRTQSAFRFCTTMTTKEGQASRAHGDSTASPHSVAYRGYSLWRETISGAAGTLPKVWVGYHQVAMRPLPGVSTTTPVIPPGKDPCYTPNPSLLFVDLLTGTPSLLFRCGGQTSVEPIVVPVKAVYMVTNSLLITRISDGRVIPCLTSSFSIDFDSWTWGFNATLPISELQYVKPVGGAPIEIAINCNGTLYHFVVEKISRSRSFGKTALTVSGRGKSCYLDAPYAPILSYNNNSNFRSAQQLMEDALTINGVSIGWAVDWGLTDWVVPQGVWSHQGSYISAINAIAQAAGGYVQADRVTKTLHVLPRYPHKPWEWNTATPDFVLPSAVTKNEGIEWIQQPDYNAVYVSGETTGVLGYIKRQGTAGDKPAPMVVDKLITHSDAALQRGISILSNTGPQAMITLSLPVLPSTGIIHPGKYVEYQDGGESFFGIVRSTSVDAKMPSITQTLGVETHV